MLKKQTKSNYPTDDASHLMQTADRCSDLDVFYSSQFVQNESTSTDVGGDKLAHYSPIEHTPILAGTMTGTIYAGTIAIQTFVVNEDGFCFYKIGNPSRYAVEGTLDLITGEMTITYNRDPSATHLVVSYEYNMECQHDPYEAKGCCTESPYEAKCGYGDKCESTPIILTTADGRKIERPTFRNFFTHKQLMEIAADAATRTVWDFNTCLGNTIKEKYESLYVKVAELSGILEKKGAAGYLWIAASPEVTSIFETCTAGYYPSTSEECDGGYYLGVRPIGLDQINYCGSVSNKWRLYKDSMMPVDMLVIGVNDKIEDNKHYGVMKIANFVI